MATTAGLRRLSVVAGTDFPALFAARDRTARELEMTAAMRISPGAAVEIPH